MTNVICDFYDLNQIHHTQPKPNDAAEVNTNVSLSNPTLIPKIIIYLDPNVERNERCRTFKSAAKAAFPVRGAPKVMHVTGP